MTEKLTPENRAKYVHIIDSLLAGADLESVTRKSIRNGIQAQVDHDIAAHKEEIKILIEERFDIFNAKQNGEPVPIPSVEAAEPAPTTNGVVPSTNGAHPSPPQSVTPAKREESEALSDVLDAAPPKKKVKTYVEESDAAIAARLQAEENGRARATRGGNTKKTAPVKKKTPKKKSKVSVDDSDDSVGGGKEKPVRNTGFHKPLNLSPALANLFDGEYQMSRPQVTKRIWQYIKGHELQDPGDKRYINCDEKLRELFQQEKVHMFTMTKLLNEKHMYPLEE